ncbi:LacI family DNA-binding transcriptional regulator [Actinotignum sanguinis]|nr:LacI family DNA-binding transcriptional regulator [Actinotignum sanguinis]MDY5147849.1 LacI family DNA-binding transcriptional regulator [Actinotignum sanguinis]
MAGVPLSAVAAAAGVSTGTASRALRGRGRVAPATIARVQKKAEELGYFPNAVGKALRDGKSRTVGMLVPHLENPFFVQLLRAAEEALHRYGYELILADSRADVELERRRLDLLLARQVDGIIAIPAVFEQSASAIAATAARVPLVQVDRMAGPKVADFVGLDNHASIDIVLRHIADAGAKDVLFIGVDDATSTGRERDDAMRTSEIGSEFANVEFFRHQYTFETGVTAIASLTNIPDAVICADDLIAVGALGELTRRGINVPREVMVTGFDGTVLAQVVEPQLTTLAQPVENMMEAAITQLFARADLPADAPATEQRFTGELVLGSSTKTC